MVCVFLSFMLGEDRIIKEFGLSLASAVFLDAVVVRCLLLPATLNLIGQVTWQIPAWLERLLPRLNVEGTLAGAAAGAGGESGGPTSPAGAARTPAGIAAEGADG
jgi:RND superfamily putative drug exporter